MQNFKNLDIWNKAHLLVLAIYKATAEFPKDELYGLTSQMRRSGVSVPSNIAEGCGRKSKAEFCNFLQIAIGSANELAYQIMLSHDLQYLSDSDYETLSNSVEEVRKMLIVFTRKVNEEKG